MFQQILWRASSQDPISVFDLCKVTYCITSSAYQAIRTLLQLASEESENFPEASESVRKNMYVDDVFVFGADTIEEAIELAKELLSLVGRRFSSPQVAG